MFMVKCVLITQFKRDKNLISVFLLLCFFLLHFYLIYWIVCLVWDVNCLIIEMSHNIFSSVVLFLGFFCFCAPFFSFTSHLLNDFTKKSCYNFNFCRKPFPTLNYCLTLLKSQFNKNKNSHLTKNTILSIFCLKLLEGNYSSMGSLHAFICPEQAQER